MSRKPIALDRLRRAIRRIPAGDEIVGVPPTDAAHEKPDHPRRDLDDGTDPGMRILLLVVASLAAIAVASVILLG